MSKRSIESQQLVNDGYEDMLINQIAKLIKSYDLYGVPPSIDLLDGYQKATSSGYVNKNENRREPLSLQFKSNQAYNLLDSTEKFSQMGFGYTYFFYFTKFVVLLGFFPLAVYGIAMLVWFSLGSECLDKSTLLKMNKMSNAGKSIEALELYYGQAPILSNLKRISGSISDNKTEYDPVLRKFVNLNCQIYKNDKKCRQSHELNCSVGHYSVACDKLTIKIVASNYIRQICKKDWLSVHSAGNRLTEIYDRPIFIDLCDTLVVVCGCFMIAAFYYVYEARKLVYKGWNPKIEEFTIMLSNLKEASDPDLEANIKEALKSYGLTTKQVNLCFDTKEFQELFDKLQNLQSKKAIHLFKKQLKYTGGPTVESPQSFDLENDRLLQEDRVLYGIALEISKIERKINEYRQSYRLGPMSSHFLGTAYVTLNSHQEKMKALNILKTSGWLFNTLHPSEQTFEPQPLYIKKQAEKIKVWVEDTCSPQDVIWKNIRTSIQSRFYRMIFANLLTLFIIMLNFWIILMIKFEGVRIAETRENEDILPRLPISYEMTVNLVIALVIFAINQLMRLFLKLLAAYESKNTFTSRELMITHKLWKVQFVTAVFMPVGASLGLMDTYGKNGLIYTMTAVMMVYVILPPMTYMTCDAMLYFKMFMRWRIRGFSEGKNSHYITLQGAMKHWLKSDFVMSFGYSRVVRNLAIVMFLVPIMPISVLFFVLMTVIFYWVNKYIVVYRSNKLISYSTKLCRKMIDELEICLAMFVCGIIYRDVSSDYGNLRELSFRPLHIVLGVIVSGIHIFSLKVIIKKILPHPKAPDVFYSDLIKFDPNSYYLSNPAYDKQELSTDRPSKRMSQSKLATHITFYVKPVHDLYEIDDQDNEFEHKYQLDGLKRDRSNVELNLMSDN